MEVPEINLNLNTVKVGQYNIDDMIRMFGERIKNATYENEFSKGIIGAEMIKMCRRWKFWNRDIRKAYQNYYGLILMPYIVVIGKPEIHYGSDLNLEKYQIDEINDPK